MDIVPRDEKRLGDATTSAIVVGRIAIVVLWATKLFSVPAVGEGLTAESPPLKCDIGPVAQTYGMTQWMVYSCNDHRSVIIVSAPGNPAMPFYFTFFPRANGYQIFGEGTGRKDATVAAYDELKALTVWDITVLIQETKQLEETKQQ